MRRSSSDTRAKRVKRTFRPVEGVTKDTVFDYTQVELLRKFMTPRGKIVSRSRNGLTARQQRQLTRAIKRARILALLPFVQ